jgi:hypothetical protein
VEREKDISDELRLISPVVDSISLETPYGVPGGYFDAFSAGVMSLIKAEERLSRLRGLPVYTVPEGYFDGFAQKVLARIKAAPAQTSLAAQVQATEAAAQTAQAELEQISPLLSKMNKKTPFEAPEGYVSELLTNVVSGVKAIEFVNDELEHQLDGPSALATPGLKNKLPYQAPEGYFENLAAVILARIQQPAPISMTQPATASSISATASPAGSSSAGSSPTGSSSVGSSPAKVISMHGRRNWWKYSAAAAVAGLVITIGSLGIFNKHASIIGSNDINLSKVSDQEIENYLDNHNVPVAESVTNSTVNLDISDSDIKNMLGDVSDAELKQYLDEHVGSRDLATN